MTFYANSPPLVTRRPSKLSPSDRLARPAQGGQSTPKTSPVASPQSGRSPVAANRKSGPLSPTSGTQIPASLIPAHGPKSQTSRQVTSNDSASSVTPVKHRNDSLPPLPVDKDTSDGGSGKNPRLPAALYPGGRSSPRAMSMQSRNRATSTSRPPPETLPEQLNRRTLSDTPALYAAPPLSQLQAPLQSHSPEVTSMTGQRIGSTPSIIVAEHHPSLAFPTPLTSPPGSTQGYMQQTFIPAPAQDYSRTLSPFQPPIPLQSPHTPPGHPQQHYDTPPLGTSLPSYYPQYTQYPSGPTASQALSPPQTYPQQFSTQPQQQQSLPQYYSQQPPYPLQSQQYPPYQQTYLPPQQQHPPQHPPYTQTPHPPQVPQSYQQHDRSVLPSSNGQPIASQLQSYPQTVSSFRHRYLWLRLTSLCLSSLVSSRTPWFLPLHPRLSHQHPKHILSHISHPHPHPLHPHLLHRPPHHLHHHCCITRVERGLLSRPPLRNHLRYRYPRRRQPRDRFPHLRPCSELFLLFLLRRNHKLHCYPLCCFQTPRLLPARGKLLDRDKWKKSEMRQNSSQLQEQRSWFGR